MKRKAINLYVFKRRWQAEIRPLGQKILLFLLCCLSLIISREILHKKSGLEHHIVMEDFQAFRIEKKHLVYLSEIAKNNHIEFYKLLGAFAIDHKAFPENLWIEKTPNEIEKKYILGYNEREEFDHNTRSDNAFIRESIQKLTKDILYFPVPFGYSDYSYLDSFDAHVIAKQKTSIYGQGDLGKNTPIVSMTHGKIAYIGKRKDGFLVEVLSERGVLYGYGAMDEISAFKIGDEILAGEMVGYGGRKALKIVYISMYLERENETGIYINPYPFLYYMDKVK